jgi:hypothetical protein
MNTTIHLTTEQYEILEQAAQARPDGTIEELIEEWIAALDYQLRPAERFYTDEEFERHLEEEAARTNADA